MTSILALDVGTSSVRAQVFGDRARAETELARRDYAGENDPDRLVAAVRDVMDEAGRTNVDAAGTSCFGHSLIALDDRGNPLTPVLGWRDTRSADAADWLSRRLDPVAIHARTGCHVHTSYWPAKLLWLARDEPQIFRRSRRFVSFAEYLYGKVFDTDDAPVSCSLASSTGLFNVQTADWDDELLLAVGIDRRQLPRISDEPLDDWYPAVLDGACSNIGVGCTTRERAALMIGTSGAFRTSYETRSPQPRPGLFLYRVDRGRVVEGGALSDGGNLYRWIGDTLKHPEGALGNRDPDSHGLTFLTLLGGERSPGWHQHLKGAIHGLTFETTSVDLRQAALEGIAFRFAEVADLMPEVEDVIATGGALLHDDDWLQILADALARPLNVSRVGEASLRGAAVVTLERLGEPADEPQVDRVIEPRGEHAAAYAAARERQRELYAAVTGAETS